MDLSKAISKSFDYKRSIYDKSTVFEATLEQAELSMRKLRPKQPAFDINRNPITQRSSNTFKSELFKPPLRSLQKFRLNRPQDHGPKDFYEVAQPEFYRKSQDSEFQPNFVPTYSYKPGWKLDSDECEQVSPQKKPTNSSIRAIKKPPIGENKDLLNNSFTKTNNLNKSYGDHNYKNIRESEDLCIKNEGIRDSFSKTSKLNTSYTFNEKRTGKRVHFLQRMTPEPQRFSQTILTPIKLLEDTKPSSNINNFQTSIRAVTPQPNQLAMSPSTNVSLNLSNLSAQDSEFTLRELCKGYQIVSLSAPRDNITGVHTGRALITVKASGDNLKTLKSTLMEKGFEVSSSLVSSGKKNNFKELAHVDFLNQYVSKDSERTPIKHHLESSQEVFGSSPGVGMFHSGKKICDRQAVVLGQWNMVKNPKEKRIAERDYRDTIPSYMRSTQSSAKKCRKVE